MHDNAGVVLSKAGTGSEVLLRPIAPGVERLAFSKVETAKVIGVSITTVEREIADGVLIAATIRGRVVISRKRLLEYLAANEKHLQETSD